MSVVFKKTLAERITDDIPPTLTKDGTERLRQVAEAFVHQVAAVAAEGARDGGRKTIAPRDMVIAARHLVRVYPWIDNESYFKSAAGHVSAESGELTTTDHLYTTGGAKGTKKIALRGLLTVKVVQDLLKTTRKATRDSNALACRMGEEFGLCIMVRAAKVLNQSTIEAKDIDIVLCGKT